MCPTYTAQRRPWLIGSFPVALPSKAIVLKLKVAPELADHGYCATKKLYDYRVRTYAIGRSRAGTLPSPESIGVTGASEHDGKVFDYIRPVLANNVLYGDKAYQCHDAGEVPRDQGLNVLTPVKKQNGQQDLGST